MKSSFSLSAVAVAALLATGAHATGTVSPTSTGTGATSFAIESINTGNLTLPAVVYTLGVGRTVGQDMTIIYTLPAGATYGSTPLPVVSNGGTASLKRGGVGTNEVVFSIGVPGGGLPVGTTITLTGATVTSGTSGLVTNGATLALQIKLLDQVETACVDNNGTPATCFISSLVARSQEAVNFFNTQATPAGPGVATDTATTTDVNRPIPLAGFVVGGDDTATQAQATVQVRISTPGVKRPDGVIDYAAGAGDTINVNVVDPTGFIGLAPGGFYYDLNSDNSPQVGEVFTVSGTNAALQMAGNTVGLNADRNVIFTANGTTSLGTSRTLTIAGNITPASGGIAHTFTGNSNWWQWRSNGTILETSYFTNNTNFNTRFVFMNYGNSPVTYAAVCPVEPGKTSTPGTAASGTLAVGQTVIPAKDVCTITGTSNTGNTQPRGGVRFTVNAPSSTVKGVLNSLNNNTLTSDTTELVRPTTNANQF